MSSGEFSLAKIDQGRHARKMKTKADRRAAKKARLMTTGETTELSADKTKHSADGEELVQPPEMLMGKESGVLKPVHKIVTKNVRQDIDAEMADPLPVLMNDGNLAVDAVIAKMDNIIVGFPPGKSAEENNKLLDDLKNERKTYRALAPMLGPFTLARLECYDFKCTDGDRYGRQRVGVLIQKVIQRDGEVFFEGNEAGVDPPVKFDQKYMEAVQKTVGLDLHRLNHLENGGCYRIPATAEHDERVLRVEAQYINNFNGMPYVKYREGDVVHTMKIWDLVYGGYMRGPVEHFYHGCPNPVRIHQAEYELFYQPIQLYDGARFLKGWQNSGGFIFGSETTPAVKVLQKWFRLMIMKRRLKDIGRGVGKFYSMIYFGGVHRPGERRVVKVLEHRVTKAGNRILKVHEEPGAPHEFSTYSLTKVHRPERVQMTQACFDRGMQKMTQSRAAKIIQKSPRKKHYYENVEIVQAGRPLDVDLIYTGPRRGLYDFIRENWGPGYWLLRDFDDIDWFPDVGAGGEIRVFHDADRDAAIRDKEIADKDAEIADKDAIRDKKMQGQLNRIKQVCFSALKDIASDPAYVPEHNRIATIVNARSALEETVQLTREPEEELLPDDGEYAPGAGAEPEQLRESRDQKTDPALQIGKDAGCIFIYESV